MNVNQKKALVSVVAENGQNLHSRCVTGQAKIPTSTMQRSLESLTNQNILRQEKKSAVFSFRCENSFFPLVDSDFYVLLTPDFL